MLVEVQVSGPSRLSGANRVFSVWVGVLPLILTVLNRDYSTPPNICPIKGCFEGFAVFASLLASCPSEWAVEQPLSMTPDAPPPEGSGSPLNLKP